MPSLLSFASETEKLTYEKIAEYFSNSTLFRNTVKSSDTKPRFDLTYGSAHVTVEILPWEIHPWEERELVLVHVISGVTCNTEITPEFMEFLLRENQRMRFGAFHLGEHGEVLFSNKILGGEEMGLLELQSCILAVVTIADTYDDIIATQFGGQRASDKTLEAI